MAPRHFDILIGGGGVVGQSIAYFLSAMPEAAGLKIGVVERDPTYATSSTALSVGGIRHQFSTPENIRLSLFSADFFRAAPETLAVEGHLPRLGFEEKGYLFLATSRGRPILEQNVEIQRAMGAQVELLDQDGLQARFPWLTVEDLSAGSLGLKGEGWLDPHSLLQAFKRKARAQGVTQITDEVVGVTSAVGRIKAVALAEAGTVTVGFLVNAAGPRAARVAEMAGVTDLPVRPRKRLVFGVRSGARLPSCPLVIDPSGVYFRPEGDGFLCGASPAVEQDPDTLDLTVDSEFFHERVWPVLAERVPAFDRLRLESSWAGHYAFNPLDQNAILGPHPEIENLFFANGFSGHGLQHSPGIGRALSELLLFGEYRTLDLSRFSFSRFAEKRLVREANVV